MTVEEVRALGWSVYVRHYRNYIERITDQKGKTHNLTEPILSNKGGSTSVILRKGDKEFVGEAFCRPNELFIKKEGVKHALGRAFFLANCGEDNE